MAECQDRTKELYALPLASSTEEGGRLDEQHNMLKLHLGSLFPCPDAVAQVMAGGEEQTKSVLDLGSGSGVWCLDVANQFPQAQVVGIDITPNLRQTMPPNCKFEIWNINQGLAPFYGQFDIVHLRFIQGIVDHHAMTVEAVKCLKPGGLVIFLRAGEYVTEDRTTVTPAASSRMPDQSWYQRLWCLLECGSTQRGIPTEEYDHDYQQGFWDYDGIDTRKCGAAFITIPMGTWVATSDPSENTRLRSIGDFWVKNLLRVSKVLAHVMVTSGRSEKEVESLRANLEKEHHEARIRLSMVIRAIWGHARGLGDTKDQNQDPAQGGNVTLPVIASEPGEYRVKTIFDSKAAWTKFNTDLASTMTPDTKGLRTIPGFDPMEE
ncbi:hypothetical protein M408DRAFT_327244 [Serendipita vermifera MAFF 305830]|uniref:Methyltransferase domain-containing protein n=1 Tax=Serendipita vermifera MAFF 305830 TaxID=933852 RepID=A0A0C3B4Q7_SERVB|nr:hypothetical protein M408DRAFT_327244 [Serendipita vermifera MAFF 305830]